MLEKTSSHFDVDQGCSIWPWGRPAFVQLYSDAQGGKRKRKRLSLFFAEKVHLVQVIYLWKDMWGIAALLTFIFHLYNR